MGNGFSVVCDECQFKEKFHIGIGMGFTFFNQAFSKIPILSKERLTHQLNNRKVKDHYGSYEFYHCDKCSSLSNHFYLQLTLDNDETLEASYDCKKCHSPMKRILNPDVEKMNCPQCQKVSLTKAGYFRWD